jgi:hypothetical protein
LAYKLLYFFKKTYFGGIMTLRFFFLLLFVSQSLWAYTTHCEISAGKANGYATTKKYKSLTVSGNVRFIFYDNNYEIVDEDKTYSYHYMYDASELIESVRVPRNATRCFFDISEAVKSEENDVKPPSQKAPLSFCQIVEGVAFGYVKTPKYKSVTVSGNVSFIFYDNRHEEIDRDTIYTYDYLYDETDVIEKTRAPSRAMYCEFDISKAL